MLEVYPDWLTWYPGDPPYARIEAERLFAYAFQPETLARLVETGGNLPEI